MTLAVIIQLIVELLLKLPDIIKWIEDIWAMIHNKSIPAAERPLLVARLYHLILKARESGDDSELKAFRDELAKRCGPSECGLPGASA